MVYGGMPNNYLTVFIFRMSFIIENKRQWIFENSYGFIETDAVLL